VRLAANKQMKSLALIVLGIIICRTFDPTWDIVGFWSVLGTIVGALTGVAMIVAGTVSGLAELFCKA
jgi:hypothetical protein